MHVFGLIVSLVSYMRILPNHGALCSILPSAGVVFDVLSELSALTASAARVRPGQQQMPLCQVRAHPRLTQAEVLDEQRGRCGNCCCTTGYPADCCTQCPALIITSLKHAMIVH